MFGGKKTPGPLCSIE